MATATKKNTKWMNEALKEELEPICRDISNMSQNDIKRRYDAGHRLLVLITDESGRFGPDPRDAIYRYMSLSRDVVRPMIKVAENFNENDIERLAEMRNPETGDGLTWSHVVSLSRMPDTKKAMAMAERAAAKGWSSKELSAEVVRTAGGPRSKGGRKKKQADTIEAALTSIITTLASVSKSCRETWSGAGGVADLFEVDKSTSRLADQIEKAASAIEDARSALAVLGTEIGAVGHQARAATSSPSV